MSKRLNCDINFTRFLPGFPISMKDIQKYKANYVGSELEQEDIKKAYIKHQGCLNQMSKEVLFMDHSNEPRIKRIINLMILKKELPRFKSYMQDNQIAQFRRFKDYRKEENKARSLVCFQKSPQIKKTERLKRVGKIIKKYKPKPIKSRKLRPKKEAVVIDHPTNESYLKSTVSFMGEVVKGLFG